MYIGFRHLKTENMLINVVTLFFIKGYASYHIFELAMNKNCSKLFKIPFIKNVAFNDNSHPENLKKICKAVLEKLLFFLFQLSLIYANLC